MNLSWAAHAVECAAALVLVLGPVPWVFVWLRRLRTTDASERFVVGVVFWCSAQMGIGILLGLLGILDLRVWMGSMGLAAGTGPWKLRSLGRAVPTTHDRVTFTTLFGLGVVAAALVWDLVAKPMLNVDSLLYHLPQVAMWYQTGELALLPHVDLMSRYPFAWEMLTALVQFPLRDDVLSALPNVLIWMTWGVSTVAVARRLGVKVDAAWFATALMLSMPMVLQRINAVQVDIAVAAFVSASVLCGLLWLRDQETLGLTGLILCTGIALGLKVSGVVFMALAWLFLALTHAPRVWRKGLEAASRWQWSAVGVALLIGAPWYVRNLIDLGNPLGHVEVKLGDWILFEGKRTTRELRATTLASSFEFSKSDLNVARQTLLRWGSWPLAGLAAGAALSPLAFRGRWRELLALTLCLVAAALLYWTTPFSANNGNQATRVSPWIANGLRYGFPVLGFLALLAGRGLRWVPAIVLRLLTLVAAGWGAWKFDSSWTVLMAGAGASIIVVALARFSRVRWPWALVLVTLLAGLYPVRHSREDARELHYGQSYLTFRDELEPGSIIALVASSRAFLVWGNRMQHEVVGALEVAEQRPQWLEHLRQNDVEYVAMGPYPRAKSEWKGVRERRWANERDRRFSLLFGTNLVADIFVYRFDDLP